MRHALVIARREIESYFVSPIAYAVITVFTFVSGLFFSNMLVHYVRQAALADAQIQKFGRSDLQLDVPDGRAGPVLPERGLPADAGDPAADDGARDG